MNAQRQGMRKIYAAVRLKTALRIIKNKIADFDSAASDLEIPLHGREPAGLGILIVTRNQRGKVQVAKRYIARVQFAVSLNGTRQTFPAHALRGER